MWSYEYNFITPHVPKTQSLPQNHWKIPKSTRIFNDPKDYHHFAEISHFFTLSISIRKKLLYIDSYRRIFENNFIGCSIVVINIISILSVMTITTKRNSLKKLKTTCILYDLWFFFIFKISYSIEYLITSSEHNPTN